MRGAVIYAPGDVRVEERDEPQIVEATDAIIRVSAACVCGSDLWPYRGIGVVSVDSTAERPLHEGGSSRHVKVAIRASPHLGPGKTGFPPLGSAGFDLQIGARRFARFVNEQEAPQLGR